MFFRRSYTVLRGKLTAQVLECGIARSAVREVIQKVQGRRWHNGSLKLAGGRILILMKRRWKVRKHQFEQNLDD
jgi:hypothetical protein